MEQEEAITSLVLLHFFWLKSPQKKYEGFETFRRRRLKIIKQFFPKVISFPVHPTKDMIEDFPFGVVCTCGCRISNQEFGVLEFCFECLGSSRRKKKQYWPDALMNEPHLHFIPKFWHVWAHSVAIQLETERLETLSQPRPLDLPISANHNSVTAQGDLN